MFLFCFEIEALETEKRQIEATLRSLQRHVEQCKGECELRAKEVFIVLSERRN